MRALFLLIAAALAPSTAQAGDWRTLRNVGTTFFFVDGASIERAEGSAKVWTMVLAQPGNTSTVGHDYILLFDEYDCPARRARNLQWAAYTMTGEVADRGSEPDDWSQVTPGSVAEAVFQIVCESSPTSALPLAGATPNGVAQAMRKPPGG